MNNTLKSDTNSSNHTPSDVHMLEYFWTEKGDIKRYINYDRFATNNPSEAAYLERIIEDASWAEKRIGEYIKELRNKFPLPEEV